MPARNYKSRAESGGHGSNPSTWEVRQRDSVSPWPAGVTQFKINLNNRARLCLNKTKQEYTKE